MWELAVLRIGFRWNRARFDCKKLTELFDRERSNIMDLVDNCSDEQASQPALIKRIRGIEDSSRCWSVYMTVEHLRIVNRSISAIVGLLTAGRVPQRTVSIAEVKPSADADRGVVEGFEDGCANYQQIVRSQGTLKTELKFSHPWIGPMNALDWHALAAKHMSIHRVQIEKIMATF